MHFDRHARYTNIRESNVVCRQYEPAMEGDFILSTDFWSKYDQIEYGQEKGSLFWPEEYKN